MVNSEYMLRSSEGLSEGVGLAPMEGVSDFPMRLWMSLTCGSASSPVGSGCAAIGAP